MVGKKLHNTRQMKAFDELDPADDFKMGEDHKYLSRKHGEQQRDRQHMSQRREHYQLVSHLFVLARMRKAIQTAWSPEIVCPWSGTQLV